MSVCVRLWPEVYEQVVIVAVYGWELLGGAVVMCTVGRELW